MKNLLKIAAFILCIAALPNVTKADVWSGTLNLTSNTTYYNDVEIIGNVHVNVASGVTVTVNGVVSGSASYTLTKQGAGTLIFINNNTYQGPTFIETNAGTFQVGGGDNSTTGTIVSSVTVNTGATLKFNRRNAVSYDGTLNGGGTVIITTTNVSESNVFTISKNHSNFTGTVELTNYRLNTGTTGQFINAKMTLKDRGKVTVGSTTTLKNLNSANSNSEVIIGSGVTCTINGAEDLTFAGVISGTNSGSNLIKAGSGKLTLNSVNTYAGTTTINAGTIALGVSGKIETSSAVTLTGSGKLQVVSGNKTVKKLSSASSTSEIIISAANNELIIETSVNAELFSKISGAGGITKNGTYTLTLRNGNTYEGLTTINNGKLVLGNSGTIVNSSGVMIKNSSKLEITGDKTIKSLNTISSPNSEVILGGNLTIGITGQSNGGGVFSGKFTGTGGVTKTGNGIFIMDNYSTADGEFVHNQGRVDLTHWRGNYKMTVGAILAPKNNFGHIGGNFNIQNGTIILDINSGQPAFLEVAGSVTAAGSNTIQFLLPPTYDGTVIYAASGITSTTPYVLTPISSLPYANLTVNAPRSLRFNTKAALSGTVTITGNTMYGETLTANTSALTSIPVNPNLGTLTYQWKRDGSNIPYSQNATYTLVQADIGATITVTVEAENCSGSVTSNPTTAITKATQTAPAAPTMLSHTTTSITLTLVSGCEYSINGSAFTSNNTFAGLTPNTSYTFTQRKAETNTHLASPISSPASFSTESGITPTLTGIVSITGNAVFGQMLSATTNLSSTPPGDLGALTYQWESGATVVGSNSPTYTLVQTDIGKTITVTVTAANCSGSITSPATAPVQKAEQPAPAAPTMLSATTTTITLNAISDGEYNINGGSFTSNNIFGGLMPDVSYTFTQRKTETDTHLASPVSAAATFSTIAGSSLTLGGTVTISGNAVFGEMLIALANLTSIPAGDIGALTYEWKCDAAIIGSNNPTYTTTSTDIGKTITVTVTAANCSGSVTSPATDPIQKATQTAPEAPTLLVATATTITLNAIAGYEYNINDGMFNIYNCFEGLMPDAPYTFTQRKAETDTHLSSPPSPSATFNTLPASTNLYTITATVNNPDWGTITPSGIAIVEEDNSITFYFNPNSDCQLSDVLVDGESVGTPYTYSFTNVHAHRTITAVFEGGVGIEETKIANGELKVYPNPTTGMITISDIRYPTSDIRVFDLMGRLILIDNRKSEIGQSEIVLDVSYLPTGIYFLRVGNKTAKFVKQ